MLPGTNLQHNNRELTTDGSFSKPRCYVTETNHLRYNNSIKSNTCMKIKNIKLIIEVYLCLSGFGESHAVVGHVELGVVWTNKHIP